MKLAILGADTASLAIARAAVASERHELAWVCELDDGPSEITQALRAVAARAKPAPDWETLLDPVVADAVIVARSQNEDRRADQLRKFVQAGMPMLIAHPVVDSMLVYYELDMIRRETGCVMLPFLPARWHPAAVELARWFRDPTVSPIGQVEQVVMERHLAERSKPVVLSQFARDVDLVRSIGGDVTRLGAMGGASEEAAYGSLGVQMTGPGGVLARWSVGPAEAEEGSRLALLGAKGKATLHMPAGSASWWLEVAAGGETARREFSPWDPAHEAIERLGQAVEGKTVEPNWVDAARSIELTETIDRSLRKGRTIELYYEDYTEEGTFKGTMASLGCGLLLACLMLLVLVALADQLHIPNRHLWPYALTGLLAVFLVLQLLLLLFRKK